VSITAKDVQNLRQATGVGMMDAKRALEESNGDMEAAIVLLRVQGLASAEKRASRDASEGAVAVVRDGNVAAIVELRCETDFVAKSQEFVALADEIAAAVVADGEDSVAHFKENIETMLTTLKENISIGRVYRLEAGPDEVIDTYQHIQADRGVNAVIVVLSCTSHSPSPSTSVAPTFPLPRSRPSARPSKRSRATKASPKRRYLRFWKVD
jgi:elongation factor Ts